MKKEIAVKGEGEHRYMGRRKRMQVKRKKYTGEKQEWKVRR